MQSSPRARDARRTSQPALTTGTCAACACARADSRSTASPPTELATDPITFKAPGKSKKRPGHKPWTPVEVRALAPAARAASTGRRPGQRPRCARSVLTARPRPPPPARARARAQDEKLRELIEQQRSHAGSDEFDDESVDWSAVSAHFSERTEMQCSHRWSKVLNPELVKGPWTTEVRR